MNIIEKTLTVLCRHLEDERQCLLTLTQLLDDEAVALRGMALTELEVLAHRKEALLNQQATFARERRQLLTEGLPESPSPSLAQAIAMAPNELGADLTSARERLLSLAQQITSQNIRNRTFASTGHGLVTGLFRIIGLGRSRHESTYSSNGKIRAHLLSHSSGRGAR